MISVLELNMTVATEKTVGPSDADRREPIPTVPSSGVFRSSPHGECVNEPDASPKWIRAQTIRA